MKALILTQSSQVYNWFISTNRLNPRDYKRVYSAETMYGNKDCLMIVLTQHGDVLDWRVTAYLTSHNIDVLYYNL